MKASAGESAGIRAGKRSLMLLQNNSYPEDGRVAREATALTGAGHQVTVISPGRPGQPWHETIDGIRCYRYRQPPAGDSTVGYLVEYGVSFIATLFLSFVVLVRHGFDVIHAHNPPDFFVLIAAPYKLFGKRFIFDHHDLAPEMYVARFSGEGNPALIKVLHFFERLTFRLADHVITTNGSYRDIAIERGGLAPERVTIVRNGPDLERVRPIAPDTQLVNMRETVIGYVGEMGVQDGIDYLIRSLAELLHVRGRSDFHCVLIGKGTDKPRLEALTAEIGLSSYVTFTGRISDEELFSKLSAADICVSPDPKNEFTNASTMIKITEYMALGKPVVAFDLREHRVTAGPAALYAKPNEIEDMAAKIERLMDDPRMRQEMGTAGYERLVAGLTWEHSIPELLVAYEETFDVTDKREEAASPI